MLKTSDKVLLQALVKGVCHPHTLMQKFENAMAIPTFEHEVEDATNSIIEEESPWTGTWWEQIGLTDPSFSNEGVVLKAVQYSL